MRDVYWVLAFFGLFMGTICLDGFLESKANLEVAMWQAHKLYAHQESGR